MLEVMRPGTILVELVEGRHETIRVIIADLLRDYQSSLVNEGVDAYHSRASPVAGRFSSATNRLDTRQRLRTATWVVLPA